MKFKFADRVKITQDDFYKDSRGFIVRPNHENEVLCYTVRLYAPGGYHFDVLCAESDLELEYTSG